MPRRAGKKRKQQSALAEKENNVVEPLPATRTSDEPPTKKVAHSTVDTRKCDHNNVFILGHV